LQPQVQRQIPYSAASNNANKETTGFEGAPRERAGKKFHFNPKGKYIAMADQMRQEQQTGSA
jgi:U4/U6 small nuclear ribonucleoprotein PRP3